MPQINRTATGAGSAYSGNLGYLFNKLFYMNQEDMCEQSVVEDEQLQNNVNKLTNMSMHTMQTNALKPPPVPDLEQFSLTTLYPGLYIGLGYDHGIPGSNEDCKAGCFFDFTTGLPVLPASSVKGCLRSCFEQLPEDTLEALGKNGFEEADDRLLKTLTSSIFEGVETDENGKARSLPLRERFLFFDAYPCGPLIRGAKLLGVDYITPHRNPLGEPKPLKMLKIRGGVEWRFSVRIPSCGIWADHQRRSGILRVFRQLIADWGIGAKTHVGYGNFQMKE